MTIGVALGIMSSFLGIGGGVVGRLVNKRIDNKQVEKLFVVLMFVIIGISCYNTWAFMK